MLEIRGSLEVKANWKIAIVTSRFNDEITSKLRDGCLIELENLGFRSDQVVSLSVPGAYEIPLAAKHALTLGFSGVVALGAIIRGETSHYDYVCNAVERGCTELQLHTGKPVVFGVLTTENEAQAIDRIGGAHGHKGIEAARVLTEMLNLLEAKPLKQYTKEHSL